MNTNENTKNNKKEKNIVIQNIKTYTIILILSLITCGIFLRFHLVSDTYWNIGEGYENYKFYPLKDGRIINYLMLCVAQFINIPFEIYQLIMVIGSILCYNYAVYILFNFFIQKLNSKEKIVRLITFLGSFLIIYNPMTVESFAYTEMVIPLSIAFFTKAAILLNKQTESKSVNTIKSIIYVVLGSLCYQGTICFFATISIFCFTLNKDSKFKDWIKCLLKTLMVYLIGITIMVATIYILNRVLGTVRDNIEISLNIIYKIKTFIIISIYLLIKIPFNLFQDYLIVMCIITSLIILIIILRKENTKNKIINFLKYIMIVIVSVCSANCILLIQNTISVAARTSFSIGAIIGVSIIYLLFCYLNYKYKIKDNSDNKPREYDNMFVILLGLSIVFILINMYNYNNLAIQNYITQNQDKIYCEKINECITEYEESSNIKVKKAVFTKEIPYYDTYFNFRENIFTAKGIVTNYSDIHCLNYYTKRDLIKMEKDDYIYNNLYGEDRTNNHEFNKNQVKFWEDTVYIRIY